MCGNASSSKKSFFQVSQDSTVAEIDQQIVRFPMRTIPAAKTPAVVQTCTAYSHFGVSDLDTFPESVAGRVVSDLGA